MRITTFFAPLLVLWPCSDAVTALPIRRNGIEYRTRSLYSALHHSQTLVELPVETKTKTVFDGTVSRPGFVRFHEQDKIDRMGSGRSSRRMNGPVYDLALSAATRRRDHMMKRMSSPRIETQHLRRSEESHYPSLSSEIKFQEKEAKKDAKSLDHVAHSNEREGRKKAVEVGEVKVHDGHSHKSHHSDSTDNGNDESSTKQEANSNESADKATDGHKNDRRLTRRRTASKVEAYRERQKVLDQLELAAWHPVMIDLMRPLITSARPTVTQILNQVRQAQPQRWMITKKDLPPDFIGEIMWAPSHSDAPADDDSNIDGQVEDTEPEYPSPEKPMVSKNEGVQLGGIRPGTMPVEPKYLHHRPYPTNLAMPPALEMDMPDADAVNNV